VRLDGRTLSLVDVNAVACDGRRVAIDARARRRIARAQVWVGRMMSSRRQVVYGVNTGFGVFSEVRLDSSQAEQLSRNLLLSHAVGVGEPLSQEVVRAAMLVRANALCVGHSGVRPVVVETLVAMLNRGVIPFLPSQGSLGSSGDLAPLAHLALTFTRHPHEGEDDSGQAWYGGELLSGREAMHRAGLTRIVLGAKEGLALTNGASVTAGMAALTVADALRVLEASVVGLALTAEALLGARGAFDARLHRARRHEGQMRIATMVTQLLHGSGWLDLTGRVQDAYSIRCAPQVLGAALEAVEHVSDIVAREINAATDNPLLFDGEAVSGGNFHGANLGLSQDYLGIAVAHVAGISERRAFRLLSGVPGDDLPPMLTRTAQDAGLNSGLMMLQYTAASLVLENQTLAHPDSVHSLPTSAGQEDFNANATTAARHARQITHNAAVVVAAELIIACQALDLHRVQRGALAMGAGTRKVYSLVRAKVPFVEQDQRLDGMLSLVARGVLAGEFSVPIPDAG
jgi:histidine ammonia-lyase